MDSSIFSGAFAPFWAAEFVLLLVSVLGLFVAACLWQKAPSASLWAACAFAIALFVVPLGLLGAGTNSSFTLFTIVPFQLAVSYLLLLIAVFVGRTTPTTLPTDLPDSLVQYVLKTLLRNFFIPVFMAVFLIVFIGSILITFSLPETYSSTARIKIERDQSDIPGVNGPQSGTGGYDPYFIQTEFEVIQSQQILGWAVMNLDLTRKWGKKYHGSESNPFKTDEALAILKGNMSLRPVRNTSLIEITCYSQDRQEASDLANAIARAYREYRLGERKRLSTGGIASLEQRFTQQEQQIKAQQEVVDVLGDKLNLPPKDASQTPKEALENTSRARPYLEAQHRLQELQRLADILNAKIWAEQTDLVLPATKLVEIIDEAKPGAKPIRPLKTLNISLGACLGVFLGMVAGLSVSWMAVKARKRSVGRPALSTP